ncbi:MAG: TolC family protein [Deltaproteobacteria bacterium]|nr:TolC family protein [Deltaproteobacteria bacterium]
MTFSSIALLCWLLFVPTLAWTQQDQIDTVLTLPLVVQRVLATHPLTQAAQARVQMALGLTRQAGAYANPKFSFENNDPSREFTYGLAQPLEWPFKRTYRIGIAKANEHIAESEQGGTRQELIAVAREAFFQVLLAQESRQIAETFTATTARLQESVEKRFQEGDVPEFEVTKAKVESLRAATDLEKTRGQLATVRAGLSLLLGQREDVPLALNGSLLAAPLVPAFAELLARAEEQNAQLAAQKQKLAREQLNLRLAWSALVPNPEVSIAKRDNVGVSGPIVGLSFSIPLWDRNEGAIAAARGQVEEAEATLRATRLQLRQSLLTAYRDWETAAKQVEAFTQGLVAQAEAAAALAQRSYQEGAEDLLGVLDAQRSLLTVRRDYAQALFARDLAWTTLERIAGIGGER